MHSIFFVCWRLLLLWFIGSVVPLLSFYSWHFFHWFSFVTRIFVLLYRNSGILILPLFEICWTMKGSFLCSIYYEGLLPSFWSIPCACFEQNLSCTQMIFSRQYWLRKTATFVEIGCSEVDIHWFRLESILNSLYFTPFGLDATQMCLRSTLFPPFLKRSCIFRTPKGGGCLNHL